MAQFETQHMTALLMKCISDEKDVLWRQPLHLLFHLCLTATKIDSDPQRLTATVPASRIAFRTEATIEAPMQPISTKTTMC